MASPFPWGIWAANTSSLVPYNEIAVRCDQLAYGMSWIFGAARVIADGVSASYSLLMPLGSGLNAEEFSGRNVPPTMPVVITSAPPAMSFSIAAFRGPSSTVDGWAITSTVWVSVVSSEEGF